MSPWAGISRALTLGVPRGSAGLRLHMRKAPNDISCQSRRWPLRALAGALGSRQLKVLGGGALGLL